MKNVAEKLKEIIDNNEPDYLSEEPYKVSDKKASMKQRLLERQRQVAQQSPPKESKPKHEVREL